MEVRESEGAKSASYVTDGSNEKASSDSTTTFADIVRTSISSTTPRVDQEPSDDIINDDKVAKHIGGTTESKPDNYVTRSGREVRPFTRYSDKDYAVPMLTQAELDTHTNVQLFEDADIEEQQIACVELAAVGA